MTIKFTNNAATTLASGITNVATSLTVASGKGALFPTLSGSDVFYATLANSSGVVEIVKVTARSTDTFTIVRGQDGTTAVAWSTGDKVELRPTAVVLDAMVQSGQAGGTPSSITLTNGTGLPLTTGVTGTLPIANGGTGLTATPANGQIDIGNGSGFTRTTLTAGSGISITNGAGSISIASSGGGVTSFIGQTGAVDPTVVGALGSIISAFPTTTATANWTANRWYIYGKYFTGDTLAGSSLAYNVATTTDYNGGANYAGGGIWSAWIGPCPWGNVIVRSNSGGRQALTWRSSGSSWPDMTSSPVITYSTPSGSYRCIVPCGFQNMYYSTKASGTNSQWFQGLWQRYA